MKAKKIMALLLASALLMTGCSNGGNENNTTEPTQSDNSGAAATNGADSTSGSEQGSESQAPDPEGGLNTVAEEPAPTPSELNDTSYADDVADSEYVIANGITNRMAALSELNAGNQVRLAEALKRAEAGEELTVSYIGGSITQGTGGGDDGCYARLVTNWFEETFSSAKINYVRAGIGATGSFIGVHRADTDVIANNPDIVFVEFSVNDTTENTRRNVDSYDSLLRKLWNSESKPAIVCIGMTQDSGISFQNYHYDIAKSYDLPFISYRNAILDVIDKGHIKWTDISDDNIHPNGNGHKVLAELITHYLAKVNENKNDISGEESDFSTPFTSDKYSNASLLTPANFEATDETGKFTALTDKNFGNFIGYWNARGGNGFGGAKLVFKDVEAQNIGLLYGMFTSGGTLLDVYVDGVLVKTINADFAGGWGNYAESALIASFAEKGTHTVEIVPQDTENGKMVIISGLMIS